MPDSHITFLSHTWKIPGFPFFLITFIYVVFVRVGVHMPQCTYGGQRSVLSFHFVGTNQQTLKLMEDVNAPEVGML